MKDNKKFIQISVSNEIHNELLEVQKLFKNDGLSITLATIVSKYLEKTKENIKSIKE